MGKKKKTREQKKLAELRRNATAQKSDESLSPTPIASPTFSYTFSKTPEKTVRQTYSLSHELRKTLFVSGGIIIFEVVLFILLHTGVLMLPLESLRY